MRLTDSIVTRSEAGSEQNSRGDSPGTRLLLLPESSLALEEACWKKLEAEARERSENVVRVVNFMVACCGGEEVVEKLGGGGIFRGEVEERSGARVVGLLEVAGEVDDATDAGCQEGGCLQVCR